MLLVRSGFKKVIKNQGKRIFIIIKVENLPGMIPLLKIFKNLLFEIPGRATINPKAMDNNSAKIDYCMVAS